MNQFTCQHQSRLVVLYYTKKSLKDSIGKKLDYSQSSEQKFKYQPNGKIAVIGANRYRRFTATVTMRDDLIEKVV